ncbi:MAG: hypothetical protein IPM39_03575 [Chloroflexi bacterium]|nr:hypothetical protein [Chloroflexota bacterium]
MTNLTTWITHKERESAAVKQTAVLPWSARLLVALIAGDVLFLLAHFLLVFTPLLTSGSFYLDVDGGYPEWVQYLKFGSLAALMALLFRRQRAPLYLFWLALFAYLLLDDALRLHEVAGLWLAETAVLPPLLTLRPQDLGELGFSAVIGLALLTALVLTYQFSRPQARRFSQGLLLALAALAFFGVAADMVQVMVLPWLRPYPFLRELFVAVEEGGEMMTVSVMVWLAYRRAERIHGWTAVQISAWVRETAVALGLLGVVTAVFALIQWGTPALVGNDGYYHAKMAYLLRQGGLVAAQPHLPLTVLGGDNFYNHHMLYHLYLALFAQTDPALDGGLALTQQVKVATTLLAALPFMAVWWLLRGQGVRRPILWTLGLFALSEPFLYRLSMPRAQSASLLVLVLGLHWLLHGRYRRLLPLGVVYVWLYDAFPLLLVMAGIYFTVVFLTERRLVWPALLYPAAGIALGLIVNPYFPQNITFIGHHLLAKLGGSGAVRVGIEWYPYDTGALLQNSGLALALWLGTLLWWMIFRKPYSVFRRSSLADTDNDSRTTTHGLRLTAHGSRNLLTLFLLTAVFALMLFRARRFIEYFPAFALIFAALSLGMGHGSTQTWGEPGRAMNTEYNPRLSAFIRVLLKPILVVCLVLLVLLNVRAARTAVADSYPADQYTSAALWLRAYSEPGSMIWHTDWDDFPRLFFYNSDARYTVGLDPTFMARHDPVLFDEWVQLTRGQAAHPGAAIGERFAAAYVFSDLEHEAFLQQAAADPDLREIYRDQYAVIFVVEMPEGVER